MLDAPEPTTVARQRAVEAFRAGFAPGPGLHLNNAGVAPMCRPAARAITDVAEAMARGGTLGLHHTLGAYEAGREEVAWLTGARPADVAYMQTCAVALTQAAFGIPLRPGERILRWDQEYPSNAYPWHRAAERAGAEVVVVPSGEDHRLSTERLVSAIDERTRVVAVSWVQFSTGEVTDLARLAEAVGPRDVWIVVDAIQGLGVLPFDMIALGVDVVCGGTHKWLCGPVGHGFLACAPGRRDELSPLLHGAITYGTPDDAVDPAKQPRHDPRRFEPGTPLLLGAAGCAAAIRHVRAAGVDVLNEAALDLADRLIEGLRRRGAHILSRTEGRPRPPIVTFVPKEGTDVAATRLRAANVALAVRAGGIRIAPHAFNTSDEIDTVLDVLED